MKILMLWAWSGFNYVLAVLNDIIRFKLVFLMPLLALYLIHRSVLYKSQKGAEWKRKGKA